MEAPAHFIHFTAQFYRHSKLKKGTLNTVGSYGLWRIQPDGSGLRYVKHIEKKNEEREARAHHSHVSVKTITEDFPIATLEFRDTRTGKARRAKDVLDFTISPDERWVYLDRYQGDSHHFSFLELASGRELPAPKIFNLSWWKDGTLWGDAHEGLFDGDMRVYRGRFGKPTREEFILKPAREREWGAGITDFEPRFRNWFPIPGNPRLLIAESEGRMSDGRHLDCVLCDLQKRTWRPLSSGRLVGISPDGKYIATATEEWIGTYKRGGARCGPLEIVTIATGKSRAITTELVSITGGYWR